jgi:hypothetical protein
MADLLDFKFTYEDLRKVSSARKPISKYVVPQQAHLKP